MSLLTMVIDPTRAPVVVGAKLTLKVQLAPAATLLPQVLVWANSPAFVPVKLALLKLNAVGRLLVKVTTLAALVVPTVCKAKVTETGANFT